MLSVLFVIEFTHRPRFTIAAACSTSSRPFSMFSAQLLTLNSIRLIISPCNQNAFVIPSRYFKFNKNLFKFAQVICKVLHPLKYKTNFKSLKRQWAEQARRPDGCWCQNVFEWRPQIGKRSVEHLPTRLRMYGDGDVPTGWLKPRVYSGYASRFQPSSRRPTVNMMMVKF